MGTRYDSSLSRSFVDLALHTITPTALAESTKSGPSRIETLPNEVLHIVLSELTLSDLKAFRQTSTKFTRATLEHIFEYLRIIIHPRSIHNIQHIVGAKNQEIRKCIRNVSFDLRMLWPYRMSYNRWHETCLQTGRRSCPDFDGNIHGDYASYVEFIEGQNAVAQTGMKTLCSYFKKFPNMRHLEVIGGTDHGATIPTTQDYVDFKTIWPRTGIAPYYKGNHSPERHIIRVLSSALRNRETLRSLWLIGINWIFTKWTTSNELARWHEGLKGLRHLKLQLRLPNPKPGTLSWYNVAAVIVDEYARFLISPARLQTLDFALAVEPNREGNEMPWTCYGFERDLFQAILVRPSFMRHIQELRFADFVFSPNDFIRLLSHNEARTLKSLSFHSIHLSEGSWLVFLRELAHAADLEHFSLSGWISSAHEGWNAFTQQEAAAYYSGKIQRLHLYGRDPSDCDSDDLVNCDAFQDWSTKIEPLEERWCIRKLIEDWVTSGGGTRRELNNQGDDPTKWAGWSSEYNDLSPPKSWNDDGFPLMQGYLPGCAVHHAPSPERQKQYRYESRWRSRLNRDFTFVWVEGLMRSVRLGRRDWRPCPKAGEEIGSLVRTRFCPGMLPEDDFVVPEEMVYEDREREFVLYDDHLICQRLEDEDEDEDEDDHDEE